MLMTKAVVLSVFTRECPIDPKGIDFWVFMFVIAYCCVLIGCNPVGTNLGVIPTELNRTCF